MSRQENAATDIKDARNAARQIGRIVNDTWRSVSGETRTVNRAVYDAVCGAGYTKLAARAAVAQSNAIARGTAPHFSFYSYLWRIESHVAGDVKGELARLLGM